MALEQTEIKKVITVDLGNTTTSLKDYKKHIDELRGSLLQLDETSEEYQKIAQEVANEQNKLNEVMKVGKTNTDAAEGSYNQLAQTMSELKKQWKATADETERAELGQRILDINNQLKELDASTGNYQRNVGDYANAFEQAFDKCLDGISSIDGPLGEIGGMTKQLIPVIKSVNATAVAGLSGVKKALASTGIGLLIVAVGELAAHWEDLKKLVGDMIGVQDTYTAAVEASKQAMEQLKNEVKEANKEIKNQSNLMAAQGASRLEVLNAELVDEKKILDDLWKQYNQKIDFYNLYKDAGARSQRKAAELRKEEADAIYEEIKAQQELVNSTKQNIKVQEATLEKAAKDRIAAIELSTKSQEEQLRIQYEKDLALAEEYGLSTVTIEQKYQEDLANLRAKANKDKQDTKKTDTQILLEQQKREAEQILARVHKSTTDELELLEETYNKEKALLESLGLDTAELTQEYEDNRQKIIQKKEDEIYKEVKDRYDEVKDRYDNILSIYDAEAEQLQFEAGIEIEDAQQLADAKYQIEQDLLDKKIAALEQYREEVMLTNQDISGIEAELDGLRRQYANNKMQYDKESADYAKKMAEQEKKDKQTALTSSLSVASSVFGALADLQEENSEEYKAFAIMETTISTLEGAINAYKSMAGIPYVGPALGVAAAAAVTLAGIANINKIRSTNKDSGGSPTAVAAPQIESADSAMASVNPLLDEQTDINRMTSLNENGDSTKETQNLRVYVVDQDIRDADHKAKVVEDNTTF